MEHYENHGDHWNGIGFEDDTAVYIIEESVKNGILTDNYVYESIQENLKILPLLYPENNSVQICSLVLSKEGKNTVESFYPVLEGIKNKITMGEKFIWENGLEGEVEICRKESMNLSFFAPFFKNNFSKIEKNSKIEVYLSGLAFFVEKAVMKYDIDKGEIYNHALHDFLKNNPKKTKKDFPFVTIHMDGTLMLFPTNTYSTYEYRGRILDLENVEFLGKKLAKTKVCLDKNNNFEMYINLYIAEQNIRDFKLEIGQDIQCVMWLTGYI